MITYPTIKWGVPGFNILNEDGSALLNENNCLIGLEKGSGEPFEPCDFSNELQSGEEVSWLIYADDLDSGQDASIEPSCGDEMFEVTVTHNDFVAALWVADDLDEEQY